MPTTEQKLKTNEYMRMYRQKNSEKVKAWRQEYRKKYRKTQKGKLERYKYGAKIRSLDFSISSDEFNKLLCSDCHYCGTENAGGVDRKDSKIGYYSYNVVPCCTECNRMKLAMPYKEFITRILRIAEIVKNL